MDVFSLKLFPNALYSFNRQIPSVQFYKFTQAIRVGSLVNMKMVEHRTKSQQIYDSTGEFMSLLQDKKWTGFCVFSSLFLSCLNPFHAQSTRREMPKRTDELHQENLPNQSPSFLFSVSCA